MPHGDRTGPLEQGSRTGRSFGLCSGFDTPGYAKGFGGQGGGEGLGRGMGQGRGYSRGMGQGRSSGRGRRFNIAFSGFSHGFSWMFSASKEEEIKHLKFQADSLKHSQQAIEKRLGEIENNGE